MSDPITAAMIGAAISGGTSLARGKSLGKSLESAAIGGALGGAGGYLGGAMGGAGGAGATTGGATANATNAVTPEVATTFMNENIPSLLTNEATRNAAAFNPSQFATQGFSDGLMNQYAPNFADIAMGKSADFTSGGYGGSFLNNIGSSALDALKQNPVQTAGLGLNVYDRMNAQPQQTPPPQLSIIRPQQPGQYNPVLNALLQKRNQYSLLG